ncbi:hypothetical protein [Streptomyces sp. SID3212]|uniref:hypothetical protein n=1 Tax=unclassified Streptomyces TaxID=2593676 RepID=UPI001371BC86|nr:hypothetical protein [Streptomyces sp. SID3212]MYV54708.1 hypothetical protein [Streptomyces sp. SID3212]
MIGKLGKKSSVALLGALLALPLGLLPATPAYAAACYDGGTIWYTTADSTNSFVPSASGEYKTSPRCGDINFTVRQSSGTDFHALVRVCFVAAKYCNSWKVYDWNDHGWMVIASDVLDNTTFRVEIQSPEPMHGTRYGGFVAY